MLLRIAVFAVVVGAALLVPSTSSAFVIDSFDDAAAVSVDSGATTGGATTFGGMFGGRRNLSASWDSGLNSLDVEVDPSSSGLFDFSLGANTMGSASMQYCNLGCSGLLGNLLIGPSNAIEVGIVYNDLSVDIRIVATSLFGGFELTKTTSGGVFSPTSVVFPYSEFGTGEEYPSEFVSLLALSVYIEPQFPGTDLQLDYIGTTRISAPAVPEPSTYVMGAMGLMVLFGLVSYRRRRRR